MIIVPDILGKEKDFKKFDGYSLCKYIQYDHQRKKDVFLDTNMLIFVIKGTKILHFEDQEIHVKVGDTLFLKSGFYVMSEIIDNYYEAIFFMYEDSLLLEFIKKYEIDFSGFTNIKKSVLKIENKSKFDNFVNSILFYLSDNCETSKQIIKLKLEEAFLNILSSNNKDDFKSFLFSIFSNNSFKMQIEKEFDCKENILDFAKKMNMTELAFRKNFKECFGTTPKKWQIQKRVQKAKILLEQTNLNVTEVCMECGFDNISWFIQTFKSQYYITPKQIKNNKN